MRGGVLEVEEGEVARRKLKRPKLKKKESVQNSDLPYVYMELTNTGSRHLNTKY